MKLLYNKQCGYCQTSPIAYDESKGELFCLGCGIIFEEKYKPFSITEYEERIRQIEAYERRCLMSEC